MRALISGLFIAVLSLNTAASELTAEQQSFVQHMADTHNFDPKFVESTLALANKDQAILDAIARPWEAKPWHQYYPIFLTEKRLQKGLAFWKEHQETLNRAEKETGVPPEIIVAIIGVETFYGSYKGKYPVLDALYTLGFYYPPRAKFFRSELEQYFLLTREENFNMAELKGSYAGAMGWGQFISSSYRHYAVDFDGDGVRDLLNNPVDAIGSVANYFKRHGWQAGQPVAFPAQVTAKNVQPLLESDLTYRHVYQDMLTAGISLTDAPAISGDTRAKLFAFEQPDGQEYWVGLYNFYVITRYNHSPLYAMAVYQFSQQLKHHMQQQ